MFSHVLRKPVHWRSSTNKFTFYCEHYLPQSFFRKYFVLNPKRKESFLDNSFFVDPLSPYWIGGSRRTSCLNRGKHLDDNGAVNLEKLIPV